jgi:ribonuclease-3
MKINYTFQNNKLLTLALTHSSVSKTKNIANNERLEFLGDSVLGLVIADIIYKKFPEIEEGELSVMHSNLVRTDITAKIAKKIDLGNYIILDKGQDSNNGRENKNILEDAMEALIGAIYLDGGFTAAFHFIETLWNDEIDQSSTLKQRDSKSLLQEYLQKNKYPIPEYRILKQEGDAHNPTFTIELYSPAFSPLIAQGKSKREAEQNVASLALKALEQKSS